MKLITGVFLIWHTLIYANYFISRKNKINQTSVIIFLVWSIYEQLQEHIIYINHLNKSADGLFKLRHITFVQCAYFYFISSNMPSEILFMTKWVSKSTYFTKHAMQIISNYLFLRCIINVQLYHRYYSREHNNNSQFSVIHKTRL